MTLSISTRLVLIVVLLVTLTAATISYYLYQSGIKILTDHALDELSLNLQRDGDHISSQIEELSRDVLFLSESPPLPGLIRAAKNNGFDSLGESSERQWLQRLSSQFKTLLATHPSYMQVRLLKANGQEWIKASQFEREIKILQPDALQNKSNEAYFKAARRLKAGQLYFSPINLNREHGKISLPHTPVLRCIVPVYDQQKLFGLIAINVDVSSLLQNLESIYKRHDYKLYVTNNQGAYLSHSDPGKRFAIELGHYYRIQEDFPQIASLYTPGNKQTGINLLPEEATGNILVFVKIPFTASQADRFIGLGLTRQLSNIIAEESQVLRQSSAIVVALVLLSILLAAAFGNMLVKPLKQIAASLQGFQQGSIPTLPIKRNDEIGVLSRALFEMANNVFSSHQELRTLNANLEDEVEARTEEVQENLRLLNTISRAQSAFIGEPSTEHAFAIMLEGLLSVSDSEYGFIGEVLHNQDGTPYLKTHAITNIAWNDETRKFYADNAETGLEFYNLKSLFGQVMVTQQPVISNDPANDERACGLPEGHPALNAFLGIPMFSGNRLVGMAGVANRPHGYDTKALTQLEPFITTCANMISSIQNRQAAENTAIALSEMRGELERVTSISPVIFYVIRAEGDYGTKFVSPAIKTILGYDIDYCLQNTDFWISNIHPDDREQAIANQQQLFETGHLVHSYRFRTKSGEYLWIHDELQLIHDENGKPKEIAGYWLDVSERKQAELQLQESEQRFRNMADHAPALIWLADTENMGTWFNKHWLDYTGRSLEQELGIGWAEGVHPDDLKVSVEKCNTAFAKREAFDMEFRLRRADGSYGWIADTGIPRFTDDGKFEGYIGYCWDITERKQTEQKLQQSERELTTILDNLPLMMFLKETDELRFRHLNRAGEELLGIRREEMLGKNDYDFFTKEQADFFTSKDREVIAAGVTIDIPEEAIETPAGTRILHTRKTVITDSNGKPIYLLGLSEDITDEKRTRDELARFKTTLDQTQDCVFMFSVETLQYFYVNQGASFLVGYTPDELLQMHPYELNSRLKSEEDFKAFARPLLDGSKLSLTFETEYHCKDGTLVPVEVILQHITHENQAPRFVAMVRDITERKKIDRMKNEFISTVSHELRTPLTSIRGSLGLIAGGATGDLPEQMAQMLHIASNNTDRLLFLINDILDIQKIESGQMHFEFKPLSVMSLLEQAIEANAAYAEQYKVRFVITQHLDDIQLQADQARLMQVMNNLMSNAAKFSPQGSAVELAAELDGESVIISVTDHGEGIPEEFQPSLFEQFTQSDASDSRQKGGTGLGLYIVKAIIEKHQGEVNFSTSIGKGTTMRIRLPLFAMPEKAMH